jgi:hypothetical protein
MKCIRPALLLGGLSLLLGWPGAGAQTTVAQITGIPGPGLYRSDFSLTRDAQLTVDAIGAGSRDENALIAYAWILDLRTRRPIWRMEAGRAEATKRENDLHQSDTIQLPAGDYALYFTAFGGSFPVEKTIKILKMFKLGSVAISGGNRVRWNEYGDPAEWQASVRLAPGAPVDAIGPATAPDLGALIRIDRTGNSVYRRIGLELTRSASFRLLAEGEYSPRDLGFADNAWIEEPDECRRAWELTLVDTEPAGGAEKNRAFRGEIHLPAGRYIICYATDDSHAYDAWNSNPPYDPDSWGVTLIPTTPLAPGTAKLTPDPPVENVVVRIEKVGDGEFRTEGFHLSHAADFCARGLGEWDSDKERFIDVGWIEDAYTLRKVWSMDSEHGVFAAGESRNRLVEAPVHLEPGDYRVSYATDEIHSYAGWSDHPPFDPAGWGIVLRGLHGFSPAWVKPLGEGGEERAVIRLAPMGDDQTRQVRFEVPEPTTVRLIALGEADGDEMVDYGWLERESSGEKVWVMRYADSGPAGGAEKNRREERVLTLAPGRYALHYVTDDSHAFGSWNSSPPDDPQLWGVTLIELPAGTR